MTIEADLAELGFELVQQTRAGGRRYARRSNAYLHHWVVVHPDATAEVTWEFELGAYLQSKGFHVSVQDELSLLIFPPSESRGPAEAGWISAEIERADALLASVDLRFGT